jgi:hypothetical protein
LISDAVPIICFECQKRQLGQLTLEDHHPAFEVNSAAKVPIPANDHRAELSSAQYDWPKNTRENPDGSPLLSASGCLRGYADTNNYLVRSLLLINPEFLELLDSFLTKKLGRRWWRNTELAKFAPKRSRPSRRRRQK